MLFLKITSPHCFNNVEKVNWIINGKILVKNTNKIINFDKAAYTFVPNLTQILALLAIAITTLVSTPKQNHNNVCTTKINNPPPKNNEPLTLIFDACHQHIAPEEPMR